MGKPWPVLPLNKCAAVAQVSLRGATEEPWSMGLLRDYGVASSFLGSHEACGTCYSVLAQRVEQEHRSRSGR